MNGRWRGARAIGRVGTGLTLLFAATLAQAVQCSVSTHSVAFGAYDTFPRRRPTAPAA